METPVIKDEDVKKQLWVQAFTRPLPLYGMAAGLSALLGNWAFFDNTGMGAFIGATLTLISAGIGLTYGLQSNEKDVESAVDTIKQDQENNLKSYIDELQARLEKDNDERTGEYLKQLTNLRESLSINSSLQHLTDLSAKNIQKGVEELFHISLKSLEESLQIYEQAMKLPTEKAKLVLLESREKILKDLEAALKRLENLLVDIVKMGIKGDDQQLENVQTQLSRNLETAKNIDERLKSLDDSALDQIRKKYSSSSTSKEK